MAGQQNHSDQSTHSVGEVHAHSVSPFSDPYDYEVVTNIFRALSNPVRAAILHRVAYSPHTVTELVECMNLSQPMVSQHLKVLRDANVVRAERCGRTMVYNVADDHVCMVFSLALAHAVEGKDLPEGKIVHDSSRHKDHEHL